VRSPLAFARARPSFGERADSKITVSLTYRQAVVVPISKPAASCANVSSF
jgi:hypothetical protein